MIRKSALCTCLLLGAAMAAMGQSRQESLNKCRSVDPDVKITGCTALIRAGQYMTENLSVIYNNRGTAYDDKGDYDRAIQDFNEAIHLDPNAETAYPRTPDVASGRVIQLTLNHGDKIFVSEKELQVYNVCKEVTLGVMFISVAGAGFLKVFGWKSQRALDSY